MATKISKHILYKQILLLIVASISLGIAVNCYMIAHLGSDSITVFEDGLHHTFHVTMGTAALIYNIILLVLCVCFARKHLGLIGIAFCFLAAPFIDGFALLMQPFFGIQNIFLRSAFVFFGIFFTSFASAILILANGGMNTLDALAARCSEQFSLSFKTTRTLADFTLMLIGFLLGGTVGFGTIPAVGLTGLTIGYLVKKLGKYIKLNDVV